MDVFRLPDQWRSAFERDLAETPAQPDPVPERRLARLLAAYIVTGLFFMILPGTVLGVWNLIGISSQREMAAVSAAWIQAHGHAQFFGWFGTFIIGISLYSFPKFRGSVCRSIPIAWVMWAIWSVGVGLRWLAGVQHVVTHQPNRVLPLDFETRTFVALLRAREIIAPALTLHQVSNSAGTIAWFLPGSGEDSLRVGRQGNNSSHRSSQRLATMRLGVPCTSAERALASKPGKRSRRNAPIWRPSHIRNMLVSRTYMGQHAFGKRSKNRQRKVIIREVPAIVSDQVWQTAQQVLRSNQIMCRRNVREPYLLRGLIKCGLCGLTFSGIRMKPPQRDHYYRCNGRQFARGLYGNLGKRCPAKSLNGEYVERLVWADIEAFLRNPGEILERLRERISLRDDERQRRQRELQMLRERLAQKSAERDRMLGLFRRGRIDEAILDQHLDLIDAEAAGLQAEIESANRVLSADEQSAQLRSAESLLARLRKKLADPIPSELKRRMVEILVEKVQPTRWSVGASHRLKSLLVIVSVNRTNPPHLYCRRHTA